MAKVQIKLNSAGVRQVLRSDGVRQELLRRANSIAAAARARAPMYRGQQMEVETDSFTGSSRARATVFSPGGAAAEAEHRYLGGSLEAGRG